MSESYAYSVKTAYPSDLLALKCLYLNFVVLIFVLNFFLKRFRVNQVSLISRSKRSKQSKCKLKAMSVGLKSVIGMVILSFFSSHPKKDRMTNSPILKVC